MGGWAVAGQILGSLLSAGGQVAGGLLGGSGQDGPGQVINPVYDPRLDSAVQAARFDALNQLGFGNIYSTVSPVQDLMGRIGALSIDEKTKRRALQYLKHQYAAYSGARQFPSPSEKQLKVSNLPDWAQPRDLNTVGVKSTSDWGKGRFSQVATRTGVLKRDLPGLFARDVEFKAQQKRLADAGLGKLNEEAILGRARAAAEAAKLAGGAASYLASGGRGGMDPAMASLKEQDDYAMARAWEKLGLVAQFGGINLASVMGAMADQQITQTPRLVMQALGLSSSLGGGLRGALNANSGAGQANVNAASIAAQQAQALNSLRAGTADARSTSYANGISSGFGAIGSDLAAFSAAQQQRAYNDRIAQQQQDNMMKMVQNMFSGSGGQTMGEP